jgi:hypothetical protein
VSEQTRHDRPESIVAPAPVRRSDPWESGCAVRRDWPDGTHDLVGFRASALEADKFLKRDRRYWRRGPYRPHAWTIVAVSRRDFDLHVRRHYCRAPDCPTAA